MMDDNNLKSEKNEEKRVTLSVSHLKKSYGKKVIIDDISFSLHEGEVVSLIGKNGIGKSTTIDCIVGLKRKNSGEITILGESLDSDPVLAKLNIGYVPSEPILYEMMSGKEYLSFISACYEVTEKEFRKTYHALVKYFELTEDDMEKRISSYSHGMKQKVALMASIIHNPSIWILDEPTVGLDILVYKKLTKLIEDLKNQGRTIFIASHNIDFVCDLSSRVLILNNGKLEKEIDLIKSPYLKKEIKNIFLNIYKE